MATEMEDLVALYDRHAITRRQLLQGLVLLMMQPHTRHDAISVSSAAVSEPVFRAHTINHVTLMTSNVARSKAFYQTLTGLPIRDEGNDFCEFRLDSGFLGIYEPDAGQAAGFNHFCFGIENYDAQRAFAALKTSVPQANPTLEGGTQVYVHDPDGVRVQFADVSYKR